MNQSNPKNPTTDRKKLSQLIAAVQAQIEELDKVIESASKKKLQPPELLLQISQVFSSDDWMKLRSHLNQIIQTDTSLDQGVRDRYQAIHDFASLQKPKK